MLLGKEKMWAAGLVGLISSLVLQMMGAGEGPTADQIGAFGGLTGEMITSIVVMAINMGLVYLVPNTGAK